MVEDRFAGSAVRESIVEIMSLRNMSFEIEGFVYRHVVDSMSSTVLITAAMLGSRMDCLAFVFDVGDETCTLVDVVRYRLTSAIRQLDVVSSLGVGTAAALSVSEVVSAVVVLHDVLEVVLGRCLKKK